MRRTEVLGDEVCTGSPGLPECSDWNVRCDRELPSVDIEKLGVEHMAMFCLIKLHHRGFF